MKAILAVGAAAIIATVAAAPAQAREGCGRGYHRTAFGTCRADRGTYMRYVEGQYYRGHGYRWHNRWYQHRQRRQGVWIYL